MLAGKLDKPKVELPNSRLRRRMCGAACRAVRVFFGFGALPPIFKGRARTRGRAPIPLHHSTARQAAPHIRRHSRSLLSSADCLLLLYSDLSATNGSTRVARRDGR